MPTATSTSRTPGLILGGAEIGKHLGILQVKVDLENHIALEEPRSLWSGTGGGFPEAPAPVRGERPLVPHDRRGRHRARPRHHASPAATRPRDRSRPRRRTRWSRRARPPARSRTPVTATSSIGPDGEWLCILLGVRPRSMTRAFSALGRETFVTPVRWEDDGWPAIDPVLLNARPGTRTEVAFADEPLDGEWIAVRHCRAAVADLDVATRLADAARRRLDPRRRAPGLRRTSPGASHQLGDGADGCLGRRRRSRRALRRALPRRDRGGRRHRSSGAP